MLLKVIDDMCTATKILADLVRDMITEMEHQKNTESVEIFKSRAAEAEKLIAEITGKD